MASTGILKVAFVLLLAATTAYTQDTDYERYSAGRSTLGKLADGIAVNVRAIAIHLKQRKLESFNLRKVVSSLVRIQVLREEQLMQHSDRATRATFDVILTAIGNDSCDWVSALSCIFSMVYACILTVLYIIIYTLIQQSFKDCMHACTHAHGYSRIWLASNLVL